MGHEDKKLEKGKSNDFFCFIDLVKSVFEGDIDFSNCCWREIELNQSGLDLKISLMR